MATEMDYPVHGTPSALWLRSALGVLTVGIAVAALAWPT